jgi:WD40 repeat protein
MPRLLSHLIIAVSLSTVFASLCVAQGGDTTATPIFTLSNVLDFVLSPTQNDFAIVDLDGQLSTWSSDTQQPIHVMDMDDCVWSPLWSSDGSLIATSSSRGATYLWDALTGAHLGSFSRHSSETVEDFCVNYWGAERDKAFSPDGTMFASAHTNDMSVIVWDTTTREIRYLLDSPIDGIRTLAFSPDGTILAVGSADSERVVLWNTQSGQPIRELTAYGEALAFSPGGTFLATGVGLVWSDVKVWDVETGEQVLALDAPLRVDQLRWTSDNGALVGNFNDTYLVSDGFRYVGSAVRIWTIPSGEAHQIFALTSTQVLDYELKPGELLFGVGTGEVDSYVLIRNQNTGELYNSPPIEGQSQRYDVTSAEIYVFALSPDETHLAAGTEDGQVIIWDFVTGEQLLILEHPDLLDLPEDRARKVQWSADGNTLASLFGDHTLLLWDTSEF